MEIRVVSNILKVNDTIAKENSSYFEENKIFTINIMGSPGAGKTSILLKTILALKGEFRIGVIEGDIATTHDAELIKKTGVEVVQINTDGACHLDANMVKMALKNLNPKGMDLLFIENVGNLVCPASFCLGENLKIAILSVPEGDDKPSKYPVIFRVVDGVVLNKMDLFDPNEFNITSFYKDLLEINKRIRIFKTSCKTGDGLISLIDWVRDKVERKYPNKKR